MKCKVGQLVHSTFDANCTFQSLTFLHSSIAFKLIFLIAFPAEIEGYTKKIELLLVELQSSQLELAKSTEEKLHLAAILEEKSTVECRMQGRTTFS